MTEFALPTTRYARSDEVSIAYQVIGEGPLDLILIVPARISRVYGLPPPSGILRAGYLIRQAWAGTVRSGARRAVTRTADGRRGGRHGSDRIEARGAIGIFRRRLDECLVCGDVSRAYVSSHSLRRHGEIYERERLRVYVL